MLFNYSLYTLLITYDLTLSHFILFIDIFVFTYIQAMYNTKFYVFLQPTYVFLGWKTLIDNEAFNNICNQQTTFTGAYNKTHVAKNPPLLQLLQSCLWRVFKEHNLIRTLSTFVKFGLCPKDRDATHSSPFLLTLEQDPHYRSLPRFKIFLCN